MSNESFFTLRSRAFDLAGTGQYKQWDQIAQALLAEGFVQGIITRLERDRLTVMMITRCCSLARA